MRINFFRSSFLFTLTMGAFFSSPSLGLKYYKELTDVELNAQIAVSQQIADFDAFTPLGTLYQLSDGSQRIASCVHGFAERDHFIPGKTEYLLPSSHNFPSKPGGEEIQVKRVVVHPLFIKEGKGKWYGVDLMFYDLEKPLKTIKPFKIEEAPAEKLVGIPVHLVSRGIIETPTRKFSEAGRKHVGRSVVSGIGHTGFLTEYDPQNKDELRAIGISSDSNSVMIRHDGKQWVVMGFMANASEGLKEKSAAEYLILNNYLDFLYQK